jgi:DNA-binding HxlR family transcriptional regulator
MECQYSREKNSVLYTMSVMGGKWKIIMRYGELKREIAGITHKMLSSQLKALEKDGIITRKEYPQIPPKVEYSLSNHGKTLLPVLKAMCDWGKRKIDVKKE